MPESHEGHRQRLKKRLYEEGAQSLDDTTLLELLLSYALPRKDTRPLAISMLERFGTLDNVLGATADELERENGVSRHTALLISMLPELYRRSAFASRDGMTDLSDPDDAGAYLVTCFAGLREEYCILLCLDDSMRLLKRSVVHRGSVNSVSFSVRSITETAFRQNSRRVIIAHNHPSGILLPSSEDLSTTNRLGASLLSNGIVLHQHYIVADDRYTPLITPETETDDFPGAE